MQIGGRYRVEALAGFLEAVDAGGIALGVFGEGEPAGVGLEHVGQPFAHRGAGAGENVGVDGPGDEIGDGGFDGAAGGGDIGDIDRGVDGERAPAAPDPAERGGRAGRIGLAERLAHGVEHFDAGDFLQEFEADGGDRIAIVGGGPDIADHGLVGLALVADHGEAALRREAALAGLCIRAELGLARGERAEGARDHRDGRIGIEIADEGEFDRAMRQPVADIGLEPGEGEGLIGLGRLDREARIARGEHARQRVGERGGGGCIAPREEARHRLVVDHVRRRAQAGIGDLRGHELELEFEIAPRGACAQREGIARGGDAGADGAAREEGLQLV